MKKKGISLIVLVITIIVIVILATAVIVTVVQNNPIAKAKEAVLKGDVKEFEVDLNLALANEKLNDYNFEKESVNAYEIEDIKKYIPSFTDKYYGKLCIEQGRLCFVGGNVTEEEKTMLEASGIGKGSYITKDQIDDILSKVSNIPADATTTNITEYIEGIPQEQAEKFTIFQGNLYYRWEKTNMAERKIFYSNQVPFLPGDANADGILTLDDATMIENYSGYMEEEYNSNLFYVGDVNSDGYIDTSDSGYIDSILVDLINLVDEIDIKNQDPERVKFMGDYNKYFFDHLMNTNVDTSIKNAVGYDNLIKVIPNITREDAKRFVIIDGNLVYRYETLTEKEKLWIYKYEVPFNLGDINLDGTVNKDDLDILTKIVKGLGLEITPIQRVLANTSASSRTATSVDYINSNDVGVLSSHLKGTISYNQMVTKHIKDKRKWLFEDGI